MAKQMELMTKLNDALMKINKLTQDLSDERVKSAKASAPTVTSPSSVGSPFPHRASSGMPAPINITFSEDPEESGGRLPEHERRVIAGLFNFYSAAAEEQKRLTGSGPSKAQIIRDYINPVKASWAKIKHPFVIQITDDIKEGRVRDGKRHRNEEEEEKKRKEELEKLYAAIATYLVPLIKVNACYSISHSWYYVTSVWDSSLHGPIPSRYRVALLFQMRQFQKSPILEEKLSSAEKAERIRISRLEIAMLAEKLGIDAEFIINIDESALRLVPDQQYCWTFEGMPAEGNLLKMYPLSRKYTTVTAAVSMSGEVLAFQINWKGTYRLATNMFPKTSVIEFCQPSTHWNTTEAFVNYVRQAVIPYVNSKRVQLSKPDAKYLLVIDCAPIHISEKTRLALKDVMGSDGVITFLGAGCTAQSQPLDIGCFGNVKAAAKAEHLRLLTTPLQHRPYAEKVKMLATTKATRVLAISALVAGFKKLTEKMVTDSWLKAVGAPDAASYGRATPKTAREYLKDEYHKATALFGEQSLRREERYALVAKCKAEEKSVPRDPAVHHLMFRFGLPWGNVFHHDEENVIEAAQVETTPVLTGERLEWATPANVADLNSGNDDFRPHDQRPDAESDDDVDDDEDLSPAIERIVNDLFPRTTMVV